jgi:ABC-type nitrate/sulfonate/bicarbonate transport system permease component
MAADSTNLDPALTPKPADRPLMERLNGIRPLYVRLASFIVLLIFWEIAARNVNPLFFAGPSAILVAFGDLVQSGELWSAFLFSGKNLLIGFAIAVVTGIVGGLLIGRYPVLEYTFDSLINALYVTPLVALIPLIMLWFGLGTEAKIFIVFLMAVFPILINTWVGVQKVSKDLIDVAVSFCANERQLFNKIIVHATLPYIMAGLRLGIGRAIVGMVIAEFFTGINGLGGIIINAGNNFQTAKMFVPIIVLMLLGVGLTELVKQLEAKIAPWQVRD